jgi:hypothetical protein
MAVVVLDRTDLQVVHRQVVALIPLPQLQIEVAVAHSSPLVADWQVPALPVL